MAKKYIVLHHSASADHGTLKNFDDIKRWHTQNNGWRDIGYNWVVERVNGKLMALPGRSEGDTGAHCPGRNTDGVGVCIVGNFQETVPSEELYLFVADLCKQIMTRHPIQEIGGHRDYAATACPGKNFDVGRVRKLINSDDRKPVECKINIKGKEFTGYLLGSVSYFDEACKTPVKEVVQAIAPTIGWDGKTMTVIIK